MFVFLTFIYGFIITSIESVLDGLIAFLAQKNYYFMGPYVAKMQKFQLS